LYQRSWRWKPTQILASLDKLVDKFPLPPGAPPIGDTSLTHVMRFAAHSTTSPTPTAIGQSFIMTCICIWPENYNRWFYSICKCFPPSLLKVNNGLCPMCCSVITHQSSLSREANDITFEVNIYHKTVIFRVLLYSNTYLNYSIIHGIYEYVQFKFEPSHFHYVLRFVCTYSLFFF
jgi:hypothetical protein